MVKIRNSHGGSFILSNRTLQQRQRKGMIRIGDFNDLFSPKRWGKSCQWPWAPHLTYKHIRVFMTYLLFLFRQTLLNKLNVLKEQYEWTQGAVWVLLSCVRSAWFSQVALFLDCTGVIFLSLIYWRCASKGKKKTFWSESLTQKTSKLFSRKEKDMVFW